MIPAPLPLGKLPPDLLQALLARLPAQDERLLLGPGIGLDCAVLDLGDRCLVLKSDPITFATDAIGWYAVQVNANDIATTGARPRWFLLTLLLPENQTTPASVQAIADQIAAACRDLGIAVIGGHTEITYGLDRPVVAGTMLGEVPRERLVTPRGASPGDRLLLTKGVPIEGTSILAREFPDRLQAVMSAAEVQQAQDFLYRPGIGVTRDAQIALQAGRVTAMHDPTEGGLAAALWELAAACGHTLTVDASAVPVPDLARRACAAFGLDPLATIASGALLLTAPPGDAARIRAALEGEGIPCAEIGAVTAGPPTVQQPDGRPLPRPARDDISRVFE